ncbi:MAG: MBL fold metallo-hydrolase [Planctomycetota bacterium]|nr:MBL fold metallo-hydrolase [Planctomycetota bacterium]MDA1179820.1 MBL fold metallo-hydrolase [Planctomycetota bacterium]
MLVPKPIFPNVIELNFQAGYLIGCNVYLVYFEKEWVLIDIGYQDTVDEIIEIIRQMDFPLSKCKTLIATHADVDHVQGLARAKQLVKAPVTAHPNAVPALQTGDRLMTFAQIVAQDIDLEMPPVEVDLQVVDGDIISIGDLSLEVWHTPGHTDSQLSFRLGDLLFSGDNIYRDNCVGAIDAHHGSNLTDFVRSLQRIRDSDVQWLLPSHGPVFRKNNERLEEAIVRLEKYCHMADFGTCAVDWPLMDEWEKEISLGRLPGDS